MAAELVDEDEIIVVGEPLPSRETVERPGRLVDHRDAAHPSRLGIALGAVGEVAADVDEPLLEVDVLPAQGAELAEPEAGEGGDPEDRGVLLALGRARERLDLGGGEDVEVARTSERLPIDERRRVRPQPIGAHRAPQYPVQDYEPLVDRPRRQATLLN